MTRQPFSRLVLLAACAALLFGALPADAAECKLVPKKLDSGQRSYQPGSSKPDWLFTFTEGQDLSDYLHGQTVKRDGKSEKIWTFNSGDHRKQQFDALVEKQPAKYNSELPFYGVAELGDGKYAFVLDAAPGEDGQGYGLLYFDANGNGDLTDDGPIESKQTKSAREARERAAKAKAEKKETEKAKADEKAGADEKDKSDKKAKPKKPVRRPYTRSSTRHQFPAVDMKIDVGGKKTDYRFFLSVYSYFRSTYGQIRITLNPGIYYEGEIELDGRKQRVVLVDYNSNGQFNDRTEIYESKSSESGPARYYPRRGDVMFLDPKPVRSVSMARNMAGLDFRHNVEKLIRVDKDFFDLVVSPVGDELSIEPSKVAMGYVKSPVRKYEATLYGDLGLLTIKGTADEPVAVPEGEWKLVRYTIDLTKTEPDKPKDEGKKQEADAAKKTAAASKKTDKKKPSLWAAIGSAVKQEAPEESTTKVATRRVRRKTSTASATGTTLGKPIKVAKDETAILPMGPPFRPVVVAGYYQQGNDSLYLSLEIYGAGGGVLTGLSVDGGRPPKPAVKILDPDGKVVKKGHFGYG